MDDRPIAVKRALDALQTEYANWAFGRQPMSVITDTEKMHWWFAKAKQQAIRIAELEEKLETKKGE